MENNHSNGNVLLEALIFIPEVCESITTKILIKYNVLNTKSFWFLCTLIALKF